MTEKPAAVKLLYATAPDEAVARRIANDLVERSLAACINIFPSVTSVYHWNGAIETDQECVLIVKTTTAFAEQAAEVIRQNHPYDTPAVAAININDAGSNADFLAWIEKCLKK